MAELIEGVAASYRRALRAEGKSPNTLRNYMETINQFVKWLEQEELGDTLDAYTRFNIRTWLAELNTRMKSGSVLNRYMGLRAFTTWMQKEEILDHDPMANVGRPKVVEHDPEVFTDEQLAALVHACKGKRFYDQRDELIVRLLLDCGPRVTELASIDLDHIDLDAETIHILGKGSKWRDIYPSSRTIRALDRYLRARARHRWASSPKLLIGERGAMTSDGIREVLEVRGAAAGIAGPMNPHRFRHTWAHDFLDNGGHPQDLKRLAGWTTDAMLARYGRSQARQRAMRAAKRLSRGDRV